MDVAAVQASPAKGSPFLDGGNLFDEGFEIGSGRSADGAPFRGFRAAMDVAAEMIRDLLHRNKENSLNDFEQKVLEQTEKMFVREWAIIQEITEEEALERLMKIYDEILA